MVSVRKTHTNKKCAFIKILINFSFPLFLCFISKINMSSNFTTTGGFKDFYTLRSISCMVGLVKMDSDKIQLTLDHAWPIFHIVFRKKFLCFFSVCVFYHLPPSYLWQKFLTQTAQFILNGLMTMSRTMMIGLVWMVDMQPSHLSVSGIPGYCHILCKNCLQKCGMDVIQWLLEWLISMISHRFSDKRLIECHQREMTRIWQACKYRSITKQ